MLLAPLCVGLARKPRRASSTCRFAEDRAPAKFPTTAYQVVKGQRGPLFLAVDLLLDSV